MLKVRNPNWEKRGVVRTPAVYGRSDKMEQSGRSTVSVKEVVLSGQREAAVKPTSSTLKPSPVNVDLLDGLIESLREARDRWRTLDR